jgi:hypothetical protein
VPVYGVGSGPQIAYNSSTATAIDPVVNSVGLSSPAGAAVDGAGDLFIADTPNNRVVEVPAGGGAATAISPVVDGKELVDPLSVAVDGAGHLFITDPSPANHRVVEVQRSHPPALSFPTPTNVGSIDTADGTMTVEVQNIGNQPLNFTGVSYPTDFFQADGDANACTGSTSLNAGLQCDIPIRFGPQSGGALSENVTLTDNALNGSGAQQLIPVNGTGLVLAAMTSPSPGSVLTDASVSFTWTAGSGPTAYQLWVSATWIGGYDLYNSGWTTATTATVNLPANGVTLYVRLSQRINGSWQAVDYTYTEAGTPSQAALTSPTPGSTLTGASVPFTWSAGSGPTAYILWLGTTGVASRNLYNSGVTAALTETVNNLPTNGATVYARLWSFIDRKWQSIDYTYTAQ